MCAESKRTVPMLTLIYIFEEAGIVLCDYTLSYRPSLPLLVCL